MHSFTSFAKEEHKRLLDHYNVHDDPSIKYKMLAKLMEEVGEFSEAILTSEKYQRKDKLKDVDVAGEAADVIMVMLILAQELNIDIEQSLNEKMAKIRKRVY